MEEETTELVPLDIEERSVGAHQGGNAGELEAEESDDQENVGDSAVSSGLKTLAIREPVELCERDANKQDPVSPAEVALSKVLWRRIRSLQETEREVQERLERQRVEHLVEKVEDEVEYEGILDDMCMKIRAEEEVMEIERREREWELERREERLEEQVMVLKDRVRKLEEELKLAYVEKNFIVQRKQEEMDEVIQRLLYEARDGDMEAYPFAEPKDIEALAAPAQDDKPCSSPSHSILIAFEDMLKEADERHEREKRSLEDQLHAKEEAEQNFRRERHRWRAHEKQIEGQVLAMEKEIGRLSSLLKEKEASVSLEKERRQTAHEEAVKFSTMLKDEKLAHRVSMVKVKKLEAFFTKLKDKLAKEQSNGNELLKELERDVGRMLASFNMKKDLPKSIESEQFEALKTQRDAAVTERDKLEEKLNLLLKRSRDREAEIEAMWLERERILIDKIALLEGQTEHWELKCRQYEDKSLESDEQEQESCSKKNWADEKRAWEGEIADRENWLKQEEGRLLAKESELKAMQQKVLRILAFYKKQKMVDAAKTSGEKQETNPEDADIYISMASEITEEIDKFIEEMKLQDDLAKERFNAEREALEEKVLDTLSLVEELKNEMTRKENQMQREMKEMEAIITSKTAETETLRKQLDSKELELEVRVGKFRNDMQIIQQEIEKERKEREKVMDLHFASKQKSAAEVQLMEEFWERDMTRMVQELTSLRAELRKKAEELDSANRDRSLEESEFIKEKEKWLAHQQEQEDEIIRLKLEIADLKAIQQGLSKDPGLNAVGSPISDAEFLWPECNVFQSVEDKRNAEWQFALGKVAVFDKQINEAMHAIQNLREELCVKEAELQKARTEPELELERREEAWAQERERQEALHAQRAEAWKTEKEELLRRLESDRSEASDVIALLHGTIRELQWALVRKFPRETTESVEDLLKYSKKGDMVKVHASHLKEVDQYICELKAKVEDLEKTREPSSVTARRSARDEELDDALLHVEKQLLKFSPDRRFKSTFPEDKQGSPPLSTRMRSGERSLLMTSCLKSQAGSSTDRTWNLGGPLSCIPKDTIEERWTPQDIPAQDLLALALPPRNKKKWIVDTSWIEHVRKEHALLTQQIAIERQRVAALGQVEAENRWMEGMMLRALEQKKEAELKLSQLQQKMSTWGQGRDS